MNLLGLYNVHFIFNFTKAAAFTDVHYSAHVNFALFALHPGRSTALINVFSSHLVSLFNAISVWWHVIGVAVIVVILIAVPSHHASLSYVFGHRANNFGLRRHHMYWFYVLPLGFLLTMYTITGYDASAHVSEETHGAEDSAPKGVWRSVFYSAVDRLDRAAGDHLRDPEEPRDRSLCSGLPGAGDHHDGAELGGRQGRHPDLDGRPALLRHGLPDERLADDVRLLARRRGTRTQPVAAPGQEPHPHLGGRLRASCAR